MSARTVTNDSETGLHRAQALRIAGVSRDEQEDAVIVEAPVALLFNGHSHVVMMATPMDLSDFALGFALTEGIVASPPEFQLVDCTRNERGIALHAAISQHRFDALAERERHLAGRSGCGLCGAAELEAAIRPVRVVNAPARFTSAAIAEGFERMSHQQRMNQASGGAHAAGFVHAEGVLVREDVGRHNALDKLVGAMAVPPPGEGFVVITSRASYEIVHKTAAVGIGLVAAISAPTDLAIRLAEQAGITLIGFARGDRMSVYSHPWRLL
jgi:formate dehydrogenase accessory protein FdhD